MEKIKHGFTLWKKNGVRFLTIPSFARAGGVTCAVSTRVGGVSPPPYDTLNFSRSREQNQSNFLENMKRFGDAAGFDFKKAVANNYEHGKKLLNACAKHEGCGVVKDNLIDHCDGLYTDTQDLPLITYHADCLPLFFYDPKRRAAAICHAGWKGISQHIIKNALASLAEMGASTQNILAAVGPCISAAHFEVKSDVLDVFEQTFGKDVIELRDSKTYVDLPKACVKDMLEFGLPQENITLSDLCTFGNERLFYSHRRDKGKTGAMAAVICINQT